IKAVAYASGMTDSPVASATYTISTTVAAPTFSPAAGTYTSAQTVTISTTTSGASIRYTTDGSAPTETAGTLYTNPIPIATTTTIKAIAFESGMTDSRVASTTYAIAAPAVSMYVTDSSNRRVQQFDLNGNFISQFGSSGSGNGQFSFPSSVAVDPQGN